MTQLEAIREHHRLCDEIHQCILDENRFLRQHQRAPDAAMLDRKKTLLAKLDDMVAMLRTVPAASARDAELQAQLEKTRGRILQIIQLDKENEQLLLRCSMNPTRPAGATETPGGSVSMLQKIYARCK